MKKKILIVWVLVTLLLLTCSCSSSEIDRVSKEISTYNIEAVFDGEKKELYCTQSLSYINNEELPLTELNFHLYPNAYRQDAKYKPINAQSLVKAYPNGMSYGHIDIKKADADGKQTAFTIGGEDMDILTVPLESELYPGEKIVVDMEYTLKLPNVLHRLGYGNNTVNFGNWYPVLCVFENGEYKNTPYYSNGDPFYTDCANYNVKVTASSEYKGAFGGECTQEISGENTIYTVTACATRDFAFVLSKDFNVVETETQGIKISYYYYNDDNYSESLQIAKESIETFGRLFGEYKYKTLAVVQTGFVHGGMEYPMLIYISDTLQEESFKETIVHETAHQWWYAVIGNDQINNAWMDEGLTEYSVVLFYENNPQYNISRQAMIEETRNSYKLFVDIYKQITGKADTSMNRAVNKYSSEYEYVYMTYVKGELMFDAVRESVGVEKFCKGLKRYYKDNAFKHALPADLIFCLEKGSGIKLDGFINSWLEGNVVI